MVRFHYRICVLHSAPNLIRDRFRQTSQSTGIFSLILIQSFLHLIFEFKKKWATKKKTDLTEELREALLEKAKRYHKTGRLKYRPNF